jgi:hypothetical protein
LAVSLLIASVMSLVGFGCLFNFKSNSWIYMLQLIYYRSSRCFNNQIDWSILIGGNQNIATQPNMPSETDAIFRTKVFTLSYLILSIFLIITTVMAMCESFGDKNVKILSYLMFLFLQLDSDEKEDRNI